MVEGGRAGRWAERGSGLRQPQSRRVWVVGLSRRAAPHRDRRAGRLRRGLRAERRRAARRRRRDGLRDPQRRQSGHRRDLRAHVSRADRELPAGLLVGPLVLQRERRLRLLQRPDGRVGLLLGAARAVGCVLERLLPLLALLLGHGLLRIGLVLGRRRCLRLSRLWAARRQSVPPSSSSPSPRLAGWRSERQPSQCGRSHQQPQPRRAHLR